ncbi:hypothetical protein DSECCO2_460720 [anaerobic digester metagenome]
MRSRCRLAPGGLIRVGGFARSLRIERVHGLGLDPGATGHVLRLRLSVGAGTVRKAGRTLGTFGSSPGHGRPGGRLRLVQRGRPLLRGLADGVRRCLGPSLAGRCPVHRGSLRSRCVRGLHGAARFPPACRLNRLFSGPALAGGPFRRERIGFAGPFGRSAGQRMAGAFGLGARSCDLCPQSLDLRPQRHGQFAARCRIGLMQCAQQFPQGLDPGFHLGIRGRTPPGLLLDGVQFLLQRLRARMPGFMRRNSVRSLGRGIFRLAFHAAGGSVFPVPRRGMSALGIFCRFIDPAALLTGIAFRTVSMPLRHLFAPVGRGRGCVPRPMIRRNRFRPGERFVFRRPRGRVLRVGLAQLLRKEAGKILPPPRVHEVETGKSLG